MDHFCRGVDLREQLRSLDAVLLGIGFEINIVEQAAQGPEVCLFPISLVLGKVAHDAFYRQAMKNVERLLIVLFQQGERIGS